MSLKILRPEELRPADEAAWTRLQRETGRFSPFLGPGWVRALAGAGGPDADRLRVLVFEDAAGAATGFLPLRVKGRVAGPAGAPLCDQQGLIAPVGRSPALRAALRAAGLHRLDFEAVALGDDALAPFARGFQPGFVLDLRAGWDAYAAGRRAAGADVLKDCAKKRRKLEREGGPLQIAEDPSDEVFLQLLAWKRAKYAATGQRDVFAAGWPERLLRRLLESRDDGCRARLFALRQNGVLLAAHLALCSREVVHAWFIAHGEAHAKASPGMLLLAEVARRAAEEGALELDLGVGDYRFKRSFASVVRPLAQGFLARPSAAGLFREGLWSLRTFAETLPLGPASALPGKAMRRLDRARALA